MAPLPLVVFSRRGLRSWPRTSRAPGARPQPARISSRRPIAPRRGRPPTRSTRCSTPRSSRGCTKPTAAFRKCCWTVKLMELFLPALRADIQLLETYRYQEQPPAQLPDRVHAGREDRTARRTIWLPGLTKRQGRCAGDVSGRSFLSDHRARGSPSGSSGILIEIRRGTDYKSAAGRQGDRV